MKNIFLILFYILILQGCAIFTKITPINSTNIYNKEIINNYEKEYNYLLLATDVNKEILDNATKMYNTLKNNILDNNYISKQASWLTSNYSFESASVANAISVPIVAALFSTSIMNNSISIYKMNNRQKAIMILQTMYTTNYDIDTCIINDDVFMALVISLLHTPTPTDEDFKNAISIIIGNGWRSNGIMQDTSALLSLKNGEIHIEYSLSKAKNKKIFSIINSLLNN